MIPEKTGLIQAPWAVMKDDPFNGNYNLVQNNLTKKRYRLLKRLAGTPLGSGDENYIPFLLAEGLVIDPKKIMEIVYNERVQFKHGYEKDEQTVTLIPTHKCCFGCSYCYNRLIRDGKDEEKLPPLTLVQKISPVYKNSPASLRKLGVIGGGEPLEAMDYICRIGGALQREAHLDGCSFRMDIVTNGFFLTKENVSRLQAAGLKAVRVTLDPDHDNSRCLASGGPTFATILSNLVNLPLDIEIQISSNVPIGKLKEFQELLWKLEVLRPRITDFGFSLILAQLTGDNPNSESDYSRMYDENTVEYLVELTKAVDDAGFTRKNRWPRIECEAPRECENVVINMKGETTHCAGVDGVESCRTELVDGKLGGETFAKVDSDPLSRSYCFTDGVPCAYMFLCHTGCRLISMSQNQGWDTPNCEKPYLQRMTEYELDRFAVELRS